jgi:hypothetical protein
MDKKTVTLQLFMKTGGPQPETLDPEAINKYFIGNFTKQWAMLYGYLPAYLAYENGTRGSRHIREKGLSLVISPI